MSSRIHSLSKNLVSLWNLIYIMNWDFKMIYLIESHTFVCIFFMVFFELTTISDCKEVVVQVAGLQNLSLHFCEALLPTSCYLSMTE